MFCPKQLNNNQKQVIDMQGKTFFSGPRLESSLFDLY